MAQESMTALDVDTAPQPIGLDVTGGVVQCPRCGARLVSYRFYGPCEVCRTELGDTLGSAAREVEIEAYVPKMNVVANHVATKE